MIRLIRLASLAAISIASAIAAAGCATNSVEYRAGRTPVMTNSPATGLCQLYSSRSQLLDSRTILKGEPIGFTEAGAHLEAIAGPYQIALPAGNYRWQIDPATPAELRPSQWPALNGAIFLFGWIASTFGSLLNYHHVR